jgi:hypothetical protein
MSEKTAIELDQELAQELTGERGHSTKTIFLIADIVRRETFVELGQKHNLLAAEVAWGEQTIERFRKRPRDKAADEQQSQIDFNAST